jgi:hypothetical protein
VPLAERLGHQRRDGPSRPGARGGVLPQEISNSERVLLTVLYVWKLRALDVAHRFSPSLSGNAPVRATSAYHRALALGMRLPVG